MKHKYLRILISASLLCSVVMPSVSAYAAGAEIYASANHSLVTDGGTVIVAVYMNGGGTPINAVEADLNYPSDKLQYIGLSYSGSAFSINTPSNTGGGGAVTIQNGSISPITGSGLVATVTFKALAGSGSAVIGISGSSSLVNANDNSAVAYSPSGTAISFGTPVAAPSSSHPASPTAPKTAIPAAAAVVPVVAPKDVTPPQLSAIKVTNLSPYSATITWTTNEVSDSSVDYGLDSNYGLNASTTTSVTSHSVALSPDFLEPLTLLHYRVRSTDAAGNVATSPDQSFETPGVPISIEVIGSNGKPQAGATVTLDSVSGTTNKTGSVTLPSGLGTKQIVTSYMGQVMRRPIFVSKSSKQLTAYKLDFARTPLNRWMISTLLLAVALLLLLGLDAVLFSSRFFGGLALRLHRFVTHSPKPVAALGSAGSYRPQVAHEQLAHSRPVAETRTKPVISESPPVASKPLETSAVVVTSVQSSPAPETPEQPAPNLATTVLEPKTQLSSRAISDFVPPSQMINQTALGVTSQPVVNHIQITEVVEDTPPPPARPIAEKATKKHTSRSKKA